MNSPAKDIVNMLNAEASLSLTAGTDLFFARTPDDPDNLVTVFDNPGDTPALLLQKSVSDYYYASISLRVRNKKYNTGYSKIFDIMEYLHGLNGITVDTTLYVLIKALNDPQLFFYDENDRPVFLVNFQVQRRAS